MDFDRIKLLLIKYFDHLLSEEEQKELIDRLEDTSDDQLKDILSTIDTHLHEDLSFSEEKMEKSLDQVLDRLLDKTQFEETAVEPIPNTPVISWKVLFIAASVLIIGAFGYYFNQETPLQKEIVVVDVNPATPLAMVTLDNGDIIQIDSAALGLVYSKGGIKIFKDERGEIVYQDSTQKGATPTYLTVNTPKGGITKVKLSDGTLVELNAASSIRYPTNFSGADRTVFVEGEVFFDVAHDNTKPFKVYSKKQMIEVLGTSFNLVSNNNYARTTLLEGSVKLTVEGKDYILKPGEEALVGDAVKIKMIKPTESVAWKNEEFIFDNSSFHETLQEIENWYNIKMVFTETNVENVRLSGTVSRKVKLSALLKVIEMNTDYTFKIEGRRVLVRRQ
ncbi:DUF4974 domain-containing protein [Sphingobacterium olei]|uniref:DUF4974 domain-containing protein n=1 Tax=Sphingobacterium olei TaxID=2571155 RepID=A0A4U0NHQ7_9SPHI|nr:FecR family protein [Sphingobacterium olei]TJZ53771.1 DUF4974 domain-containing protein [Sphingobacterium olei]